MVISDESSVSRCCSPKQKTKKRKKKEKVIKAEFSSEELDKTTSKLKKKHVKSKSVEFVEFDTDVEQSVNAKKCEKVKISTNVSTEKTKKHKKKRKDNVKNEDRGVDEALQVEDKHTAHKTKKRKKKSKEHAIEESCKKLKRDHTAAEICASPEIVTANTTGVKKKRSPVSQSTETLEPIDSATEVDSKQASAKKKRKKSKRIDNDSQSSFNEQEISDKPLKRKKQENLDENKTITTVEASGGKRNLSTTVQTDHLGQWSNASFDNKNTQDKFIRLMGGKKAQSNTGKLWSQPKQFSTMARSGSEFQSVSSALENQYNAALSFNLQKRNEQNLSKGLGFTEDPAKGKKFYIDIKKSNSIKFDD